MNTTAAATYPVTGMTCEHCVHAVTSELNRIDGVTAVAVDLVPGDISKITVTSETALPDHAIIHALDEAGGYQLAAS